LQHNARLKFGETTPAVQEASEGAQIVAQPGCCRAQWGPACAHISGQARAPWDTAGSLTYSRLCMSQRDKQGFDGTALSCGLPLAQLWAVVVAGPARLNLRLGMARCMYAASPGQTAHPSTRTWTCCRLVALPGGRLGFLTADNNAGCSMSLDARPFVPANT
jgi:hypothetical protein